MLIMSEIYNTRRMFCEYTEKSWKPAPHAENEAAQVYEMRKGRDKDEFERMRNGMQYLLLLWRNV